MCNTLETCRRLYNRFLAERKDAFEQEGRSVSRYEQVNHLPEWKRENEFLPMVQSQVLQNVAQRVDISFRDFFRRCKECGEKPGYPRFKGAGWYDSFTYPQSGFTLNEASVTLSKIGEVKAVVHRRLDGKIKTCTISRKAGKWFAFFVIEVESQQMIPTGEAVGIDVGLKAFATLSTGEQIENPRFFRKEQDALAKAQRRMSKFEKGTPERRKARKVVARIHERIKNRRHNFVHQEARKIINRFDKIAVEKLNTKAMAQNRCLAKSINDAAWAMFRNVLTHKAESAGRQLVSVNPAYTSQDCHACGHRAKKKLSERWHCCPMCGASLDRDLNAALNILALGTQSFR